MRTLNIAPVLDTLPLLMKPMADRVNLGLAPDDGMYQPGDDSHYLDCGMSALNVILSSLNLAGQSPPAAILDFGAGAGRVTRWLRAAFPDAAIAACDLRPEDMAFCRDAFGAETWVSGTDIARLSAPGRYDLIWVGSVLTHLSAARSAQLIDKLLDWSNPGGLIVMSTIGRTAMARRDQDRMAFIHNGGWEQITRDYHAFGFGYADYLNHEGYGLSLTKLSWLGSLVEGLPNVQLVALSEGAWDGLHDIVALRKNIAPSGPETSGPSAEAVAARLEEQVRDSQKHAAVAASTLWRLIRPVRALARLFGR